MSGVSTEEVGLLINNVQYLNCNQIRHIRELLFFPYSMVFSFFPWIGTRIYQEMPPIPEQVVTTDGQTLIDPGDVTAGQNVWQSMGGMEVGSIWGHGSYVAPDWTADWLHREAIFILDRWANADYGSTFDELDEEQQAQLQARLTKLMRTNTYDPATGTITIDPIRADAFESNLAHYTDVFSERQRRLCDPGRGRFRFRIDCANCPRSSSGRRGPPRRTGPTTTRATPTTGLMNHWSAIGPPATTSSGPA